MNERCEENDNWFAKAAVLVIKEYKLLSLCRIRNLK